MPVIYDGKSIRPAPYVTINTDFNRLGDSRKVGNSITANLKGTIVATKVDDTDVSVQQLQRLSTIIEKQKEIREIFANDGKWLEIQGLDGSQAVKFSAIVESIEFDEGPWIEVCGYSVNLRGEIPSGEEGAEKNHIESASESWQYEEGDGPHTYRVNHTVQAKGKTYYDDGNGIAIKQAWQYARDFIQNKLTLGWNAINNAWSPNSGKGIFENNSSIQPEGGFSAYNRVIAETVDEADGSCNVTETFFLSQKSYWEEYTINIRKETGTPLITTVASINGTIHGLTPNLHDPEGRFAAALTAWNTVQTLLFSRLGPYAPNIVFNPKRTSSSFDANPNEGTISYSAEFDDKVLINNTYEWFNVSLETSLEDSKTVVRIDGVITGVRYFDDIFNPLLPFERANAQYQLVKLLMFQRAQSESGIYDLKPFPVSASVNPDKQAGTVSYSYTFDNRIPESVRDEFTVSNRFSKEDGKTYITVSGTITGLRSSGGTYPFGSNNQPERYNNALSYFRGIQDSMIGLAGKYTDVSAVNPAVFSKSISHSPNNGQLTYEYEFNSSPKPCYVGALSENITITDDSATPIIAIIPVIGRAAGPVIQDIGTIKEKRRSVTIEIVLPITYGTNICSGVQAPTVEVSSYAPKGSPVFLEQDQTQWSPSTGHYTRTLSWIYE